LLTFRLELLLFKIGRFQVLDRLLKLHHVSVRALVYTLCLVQLTLQLLVFLFLHSQVRHDLIQLLLLVAFLVHLFKCIALAILDSLEQLDLFLQLPVLPLRVHEAILQIADRPILPLDVLGDFRAERRR